MLNRLPPPSPCVFPSSLAVLSNATTAMIGQIAMEKFSKTSKLSDLYCRLLACRNFILFIVF